MAAKHATSIGSNIVTGGSSHDEHNIGPAGRAPDKTGVPVGYPVKDQRELATSTSVRRENGSPRGNHFLGAARRYTIRRKSKPDRNRLST